MADPQIKSDHENKAKFRNSTGYFIAGLVIMFLGIPFINPVSTLRLVVPLIIMAGGAIIFIIGVAGMRRYSGNVASGSSESVRRNE